MAGRETEAVDERALIEAAQADPRRFGDLYELWFDRLWAYVIRRVPDRGDAEDITSETFHQALQQIRRYEYRGVPFGAWLFRIAAAQIADRAAIASRRKSILRPADAEPVSDDDVEEACFHARLFAAMRQLPADQAHVLEARFVQGKTTREIADDINRTEGAVKQLQYRGLETLRAQLQGERS